MRNHLYEEHEESRATRSAFTLIEMLVAITIMLIVFSMTAGVVSLAINTDRIPSSARTVQAGLLGARDRALRAGSAAALDENPRRGIRFVPNPNHGDAISSLLYIGNQDDWRVGTVDVSGGSKAISGSDWGQLQNSNLDIRNCRIKIPDSTTGLWYRLNSPAGTTPPYPLPTDLTRNYLGATDPNTSYRLQLPSSILPNEQPLPLDGNVVINLARSRVPANWDREILFTPEGNIYGPLSAQGPLYLYLSTLDDFLGSTTGSSLPGRDPADPAVGETLIIKINTQNGRFQTFPVDPTDLLDNGTQMAPPDGLADNPFRLAQQQ